VNGEISECVNCQEFGPEGGRLVLYFHGAPGDAQECRVFAAAAEKHNLRFLCLERFAVDKALSGEDYFRALADAILCRVGDRTFDMVGFSIGCFTALQVSRLLPVQTQRLALVSAAAPLESGSFLDDMAGKLVFELAKDKVWLFRALSRLQRVVLRLSPNILFKFLFSSAAGRDRTLAIDDDFQNLLLPLLQQNFGVNLPGYMREIQLYVQAWQQSMVHCRAPVSLWHGDADNWSPPEMASVLSQRLVACSGVRWVVGASHYSCLLESAEEICEQLR